jgi:hypothetical protein
MASALVPPLITLTTDFGSADHYVGTMKGVILSRCPHAHIVDISHEITPFSIPQAAYTISQAVPFFPPATVHVVVVDPGVGTARRPILARVQDQYFVAPDNGVLSLVLGMQAEVWEIANASFRLPNTSQTFHGRDVFAPAAAMLANGLPPEDAGPKVHDAVSLPDLKPVETQGGWQGKILSVDRFGNIVTNFPVEPIIQSRFKLECAGATVSDFRHTFGEAPPGLCFAYFGSSGYLEIGMNRQSAAAHLGVLPGDNVTLRVTIDSILDSRAADSNDRH